MKTMLLRRIYALLIICLSFTTFLRAQESGWKVNPYDFQYDMSLYVQMSIEGETVTDYSNYEFGAFAGDECRGVAEYFSQAGKSWLYLRVYSNAASDETISIKLYDKKTDEVSEIHETFKFESQLAYGSPSSPVTLHLQGTELPTFSISAKSADANMGTVTTEGTGEAVAAGTNVVFTAKALDGYHFESWMADSKVISKENPYAFLADKDVDAVAQFSPNTYPVTFVVDGDESTEMLDYNSVVPKPADPVKEGYSFTGWSPAFEEGTKVPIDGLKYVAQWKVNQYTITFDTDGGSAVASITQDYGTAVKAPEAPTKEGYTFTGWDKEVPATMPATNVTIKAQWKVNQYTITFDTDGGSAVASITQDYGTAVKAPEAPTKEGYTFIGWDKDVPATMPAGDITLKAQWKVNQYTITFDTDGGSEVKSITQDYGTAVTAPEAPTKEGYTFIGWDKDVPATMPAGDITLKAQWSINQYRVTFVDGDSVVMSVMLDYGSKIELPEPPAKEGHTFTGWSPEVDETLPAHDVTYSATYEVNYYTLTYYINETEVYSVEVAYGDTIEVYVPEMEEGMEFNGWDTEIPATMPAHDVDIYGTSSAVSAIANLVGSMDKGVEVYATDGRFVQKVYSVEQFMRLPKGIYIIRGKKIANTF